MSPVPMQGPRELYSGVDNRNSQGNELIMALNIVSFWPVIA